MADSYNIYTANGSTDTFSITFGYLDPDHVVVTVDNVPVDFTFPSQSQVQITDGDPANGAKVKVYRVTPRDVRKVVWQNASNLTAADLNTSDLQLLYILQESFDTVEDALLKDASGIFDATSIRIQNVATPTQPTDAATKAYVDDLTVTFVDDAEDARDAAIAAQVGAEAALAATQVIYDNFDDRYLGQKASAPALDNDGDALIDGALYYNTTDNKMYVYDLGTTAWLAIETNIPDGSLTTAKYANLSVTSGKIANSAVTGTQLADGGVSTTAKLANGIVTYAKVLGSEFATAADITGNVSSKFASAQSMHSLITGGVPIQTVRTTSTAATSTTAVIPYDNTIPQNTEGLAVAALDTSITPKMATSLIEVEVYVPVVDQSGNNVNMLALFRDSVANALAVSTYTPTTTLYPGFMVLKFIETAGSTSARTYKLRIGVSGGTMYFNRGASSATLLGNVQQAYMKVTEIAQ
jgi:hypothetical protein